MYKIAKWRDIERMTAYTRIMFFQSGKVRRDSLDERAFMAFNISMTTRMEREMVEADLDMWLENISQPISGNWVEHLWKFD